MAQSERRMAHGRAQAKVAGDDEMLRTGFHNGTPLEAGKIADSQPVDLFAPAHRVAQQQEEEGDDGSRVIAESEPVDLAASARGVAEANINDNPPPAQGRQGMAAHAAGDAKPNKY
ncbi:unnamed protein product [Urochloa decumbens]|uniref:Uncharacterized protein n=1 Tax=Urochloa decumbens TaxID=240449 RepID=A0ABC9BVZ4_9POAL